MTFGAYGPNSFWHAEFVLLNINLDVKYIFSGLIYKKIPSLIFKFPFRGNINPN